MSTFREIAPQELQGNLFQMIGHDWMLVAAKSEGRVNMLTASWGGAGILWKKPVVYTFIRPQRFTKTLMDSADGYSLTFFEESKRPQLTLCGTKSGRDIDKVEACSFQVLEEDGIPYFAEATTALICKKLYRQTLDPACFISLNADTDNYPDKDYHDMYISEITKVLVRA